MSSDLERRYVRWTALFYPAGDRRLEVVDTYLSLAAPDQRRPSATDVADLAVGGLRQHLRNASGLEPGFQLAGVLALMVATALATWSLMLEALASLHLWFRPVGPYLSLGVVAWAAWIAAIFAPARWFRWAAGIATVMTAAVVPATALTGLPRPPLVVLVPQLALGAVTLGAGGRSSRWVRLLPLAVAATVALLAVRAAPHIDFYGGYYGIDETLMPAAALLLLIVATLLALGLAARRDSRGAWALLILLTPIGMLALTPLGALFDNNDLGRPVVPTYSSMLIASVLVATIGPALLALAVAAHGRTRGAPSRSA